MTRLLLLVEDAPDISAIARLSLERIGGWSVVAVTSGQAALDAVDASQEPFEAILLDVMMPGLDGPATLLRLRERPAGRDVPVAFLTAKAPTDRKRLSALGGVGVIAKPFDPLSLSAQLDALLARSAPEQPMPMPGDR